METRLVRGRGVSRQIGVRVTLYAVISILAGVQVGGILVIRLLRGLHVVFQRVCHVVGQRLRGYATVNFFVLASYVKV